MKKNWKKILVFLVVSAGLAAGSYLAQRVQETRRGATGEEEVAVTISPGNGEELTEGENFVATVGGIKLETGKKLITFELNVSFDNLTIEHPDTDVMPAVGESRIVLVNSKVTGNNLRVLGYVDKNYSPEGGVFDLVKIKFKPNSEGAASVTVKSESSVGFCIASDCEHTIGTINVREAAADYNVSAGGGGQQRISGIYLSPDQDNFNGQEEFTVALIAQAGENKVSGAEFNFTLSGGVELIDVLKGDDFDRIYSLGDNPGHKMVTIPVSENISQDDYVTGEIEIARFKLKKIGNDTGELSIDGLSLSGSDFDSQGEGTAWSEVANAPFVGQYSLASASDLDVNFKIKFVGVNKKINNQLVKVKTVGQGINKPFENVAVSADEKGVLAGRFTLTDALPGPGYVLVIKGPKHLGTKFCQDGQDKRCLPGQSLTLATGENNFDFSAYPLPPGDITGKDGKQDGVVDVEDFDVVRAGLDASSDAAVKEKGDLNFDGLNNGNDPILFLKTMAEKYDDDI